MKTYFIGFFAWLLLFAGISYFVDDAEASKTILEVQNQDSGWVEYIDLTYNSTNRITIGASLTQFFMNNYSVRFKELPPGINNLSWFNGSHLLTEKAGNSFLYRWRYKSEPKVNGAYCEIYYNISGGIPLLPMRSFSFPRGVNVEQIGTFTNFEYTLNTWRDNGAAIMIECPNGNVEFWDIELSISRIHKGIGVYS